PQQEIDVPKSKVRKKNDAPISAQSLNTGTKALAPSPTWYPIVMTVVLVLGLAYLVVYYLTSSGTDPRIPLMGDIGSWNFAVGFGVMLLGLVMAVKWR
ncbi:MAG: cell division protein CrgA, partial [Jatrophihabitantaceae bacterium]